MQKVYIDANVYKFAASKLLRYLPKDQTDNWGGKQCTVKVHEPVYVNPNDRIPDPVLRAEVSLLPKVADLVKSGLIKAVVQIETEMETWRFPNMDCDTGRFFGAKITHCDAPVTYGRVVFGSGANPRTAQVNFLKRLKNERFIEIQKVVGAYQGKERFCNNQLLDAFAIWCAEHNSCDALLSLDFQLAKIIAADKKCRVTIPILRPSQLLDVVKNEV